MKALYIFASLSALFFTACNIDTGGTVQNGGSNSSGGSPTDPTSPPPPVNSTTPGLSSLTQTGAGVNSISLKWQYSGDLGSTFTVLGKSSQGSDAFKILASGLPSTTLSYNDQTVLSCWEMTYQVIAVTNGQSSAPLQGTFKPAASATCGLSSSGSGGSSGGSGGSGGGTGGSGGGSGGTVDPGTIGCGSGAQVSGTPSGNSFAGHNYNGHGQTISGGTYSVASNTCIENYIFNNVTLKINDGSSNVTIENNTWQNNSGGSISFAGLSGSSISYNTFKNDAAHSTDVFGYGPIVNTNFDHNLFENVYEGMHLTFGFSTSRNVSTSYNKIQGYTRWGIELQEVVDGLKVNYNRVAGLGSALSVATGAAVIGYNGHVPIYKPNSPDTHHVEIAYNNCIGPPSQGPIAAIESYGSGNNVHDNYVYYFNTAVIWTQTASYTATPWYITNNTTVGVTSLDGQEGQNDSSGHWYSYGIDVQPTRLNNHSYALHDPNAPAEPAWNYAVGVQPNVP